MADDRARLRELQAEYAKRGDALGWFEALYREADGDISKIPWADLRPNPRLVEWHRRTRMPLDDLACLVVGCGLGDDAEYCSGAGGRVTAFDFSETAIEWCRRRFPFSPVTYTAANLLTPPAEWRRRFDFVFEANTLQTLPAELRPDAIAQIASFCARGATVVVVCRGREPDDVNVEGPPWPLERSELDPFTQAGLTQVSFADVVDDEDGVRRFVVQYRA